jgi:hypothetical protein
MFVVSYIFFFYLFHAKFSFLCNSLILLKLLNLVYSEINMGLARLRLLNVVSDRGDRNSFSQIVFYCIVLFPLSFGLIIGDFLITGNAHRTGKSNLYCTIPNGAQKGP